MCLFVGSFVVWFACLFCFGLLLVYCCLLWRLVWVCFSFVVGCCFSVLDCVGGFDCGFACLGVCFCFVVIICFWVWFGCVIFVCLFSVDYVCLVVDDCCLFAFVLCCFGFVFRILLDWFIVVSCNSVVLIYVWF